MRKAALALAVFVFFTALALPAASAPDGFVMLVVKYDEVLPAFIRSALFPAGPAE